MSRIIALVIAGLTALALTGCDAAPSTGTPADVRQVTVVGTGQVQGTPDTLNTGVSISFVADDVTSAMNQTSERQQAVINALVDAGIDAKDIATTDVSLQPQYGTGAADITGFQASNTIDVTIRDVGSASRVLALIVSTGGDATRINSVNFSLSDDSELVRDARARAFADAKDRAQQYADLSGLTLGAVITISEDPSSISAPSPMPGVERAMAAVPVSPGTQTVGFSVTAVWELR